MVFVEFFKPIVTVLITDTDPGTSFLLCSFCMRACWEINMRLFLQLERWYTLSRVSPLTTSNLSCCVYIAKIAFSKIFEVCWRHRNTCINTKTGSPIQVNGPWSLDWWTYGVYIWGCRLFHHSSNSISMVKELFPTASSDMSVYISSRGLWTYRCLPASTTKAYCRVWQMMLSKNLKMFAFVWHFFFLNNLMQMKTISSKEVTSCSKEHS